MANEISVAGQLIYEDSEGTSEYLQLAEKLLTITTKKYVKHKQNIGTSEEALDKGELAAIGWMIFKNLDATNFVELRSATGAANDVIKVPPASFALFHWGSDVTAPFAIANTAACQCEYLLLST